MKKRLFFVTFLSLIVAIAVYREYFFSGKIPFPANLLASFYTPWDSQVFPGWEHGIPNKPLGHDAIRFFLPIKKNIVDDININVIPLWNPHVFNGSPLLANMQSSFFYPTTFLYFLFSFVDAWSINVIMTPILSTLFLFLYLGSINIRKNTAIIISFLWAYSGFFAVWNQENPAVTQSALWLPFILFMIERLITERKLLYLVGAVSAMALSFFGGHLQFSIYIYVFSALYILARVGGNIKYYYCSLFIVLPLLLSSVQLIPSFEAFLNSARSFENSKFIFNIYLEPITHLINIVAPDWKGNPANYNYFDEGSYYDQIVYIGLIPLLFALISFICANKNNLVKIYGVGVLVTLLLGFKNYFSVLFFDLNIPFFSSVIPSRIFYLTSFCFLILAAISLNLLFERKLKITRKQLLTTLSIPLILLLGGWVHLFLNKSVGILATKPEYLQAMFRNLTLPTIVMGTSALLLLFITQTNRFSSVLLYSLCGLAIIHQFYFYSKNTYFSEKSFVYPSHPLFSYLQDNHSYNRFVGLGKAAIKPNIGSYFNVYSSEGLDPMLPSNFAGLAWDTYAKTTGKTTNPVIEVSFADLFKKGNDILGNEPIFALFNISGVKYIITHKEDEYTLNPQRFRKLTEVVPYTIWEFQSLPRMFITTDYKISKNNTYDALTDAIILEKDPAIDSNQKCVTSQPDLIEYKSNYIEFTTDTKCKVLAYLSDTYYPGWQAYIDGQKTEILKANYAFRAVTVPSGKHTVVMEYDPLAFKIGAYISLFTVISIVMTGGVMYVKKIYH